MIKAQFNASTLKASFVAADKKAQMVSLYGDDCEYCDAGETPRLVTASFSGLQDVSCLLGRYSAGTWYPSSKSVGPAAAINNQKFLLPQDISDNCIWSKNFPGSYGVVKYYNGWEGSCDGTPIAIYDITDLQIYVTKKSTTNFSVYAWANYGGYASTWVFQILNVNVGTITGCAGFTAISTVLRGYGCQIGGTILVEDGDTT